jgi:hypothetical protein
VVSHAVGSSVGDSIEGLKDLSDMILGVWYEFVEEVLVFCGD